MGGDITKIGRDFKWNYATKNFKYVTNLGSNTLKRNIVANGTLKLNTLVEIFLHGSLSRDDNIRISSWS